VAGAVASAYGKKAASVNGQATDRRRAGMVLAAGGEKEENGIGIEYVEDRRTSLRWTTDGVYEYLARRGISVLA